VYGVVGCGVGRSVLGYGWVDVWLGVGGWVGGCERVWVDGWVGVWHVGCVCVWRGGVGGKGRGDVCVSVVSFKMVELPRRGSLFG